MEDTEIEPDDRFRPGGKVRFGESTQQAMVRELNEEVGHPLPPGDLTAVTGNIYTDDGPLHHEIGFYYRIAWPTHLDPDIDGGAEDRQHLDWTPVDQLRNIHFQAALIPTRVCPAPEAFANRCYGRTTSGGSPQRSAQPNCAG